MTFGPLNSTMSKLTRTSRPVAEQRLETNSSCLDAIRSDAAPARDPSHHLRLLDPPLRHEDGESAHWQSVRPAPRRASRPLTGPVGLSAGEQIRLEVDPDRLVGCGCHRPPAQGHTGPRLADHLGEGRSRLVLGLGHQLSRLLHKLTSVWLAPLAAAKASSTAKAMKSVVSSVMFVLVAHCWLCVFTYYDDNNGKISE